MKNINSKIFASFMAVVLLVLSSCASTPKGKVTKCEPADDKNALLIGRVVVHIENVPGHNGTNLNGYNKKGVKVTVKETETGKRYIVYADANGIFYVPKAKTGKHYQLVEIYCKSETGSSAQWITFPIEYTGSTFVREEQVSLLRNLFLKYDGQTQRFNWQDFGNDGSLGEARRLFGMSYPDSEWNNYTFAYNFIR